MKYLIAAIFAGSFVLMAAFWPSKSVPYTEVAAQYANQCVDAKGFGGWRGSSGTSLDDYCKLWGVTTARKEMCKEYPQAC